MPRTATEKALTCRYCEDEIVAPGKMIRTAAGPMHEACFDANWRKVNRLTADRIAQGTHSREVRQFCGGCRQINGPTYWTGFDGTPFCIDCAALAGKAICMHCRREGAQAKCPTCGEYFHEKDCLQAHKPRCQRKGVSHAQAQKAAPVGA